MSDWLRIDPAKFNKPRHERIQGADVEVLSSPYDVPSAVRGGVDLTSNTYVLEFKYIGGDEPLALAELSKNLSVMLGRNSKRLYKVVFHVGSAGKGLEHELVHALDRVTAQLKSKADSDNYDVAKQVIKERAEKLVAAG